MMVNDVNGIEGTHVVEKKTMSYFGKDGHEIEKKRIGLKEQKSII